MNQFCIFITILINCLWSQNYFNVRAQQEGLSIIVNYDMSGKLENGDEVALAYTSNDGENYYIINDAEGDVGEDVTSGLDNEIRWLLIDKDFIAGRIVNFQIVTIPEGMVYVDGGRFSRWSKIDDQDELSEYSVSLNSYLMDKTEVTQREYRRVMGQNSNDFLWLYGMSGRKYLLA